MKHFILAIALLFSMNLFAQSEKPIQKGNIMIGGSGSFGYGLDVLDIPSGYFDLSLYPSVGIFLSEGFALGFAPSISLHSNFTGNEYTSFSTGLGVFLIKYFNIGIFIRGSVGYDLSLSSYQSAYYDHTSSHHVISFIPAVGYAFFIRPNVSLQVSLNDRLDLQLNPDASNSLYSRAIFSAGFQIFL